MPQQKYDPFAQYVVKPPTSTSKPDEDPFARYAVPSLKPLSLWEGLKKVFLSDTGASPLPEGIRAPLKLAIDQATNRENISAAGGFAGGLAGAQMGAAASAFFPPAAPVLVPGGAIAGAVAGGTLGSKYGEGKEWGPALKEGAGEGLVEGLGFGAGRLAGMAKGPLTKVARSLGWAALDPSPASLAQFHQAVSPSERFIPEEAERKVKDIMFDISEGAPGSLRYAKGLGSQLDDMHSSLKGALDRTGKSTGVGMDELVAKLQDLRSRINTPGGALNIPKNLQEIDAVEDLIRNRPQGEWQPVTAGALPPGPLTTVGTPDRSAVYADNAFPMANRERNVIEREAAGIGNVMASHTPSSRLPSGVQYSGEQLSTPVSTATAGAWSRSGLFDLGTPPPTLADEVLAQPTFKAEALTLPEAYSLKQKIDDALLTEYGKSAPAAIAGIKVPDSAHVSALKSVRRAINNLMEERAADATYRGSSTTVKALNDAMHKTIPFDRMAAEATGRERGGLGVRLAAGRNGPRISLFDYLGRRTAGYGARPALKTGEILAENSGAIGNATTQGLRALSALLSNRSGNINQLMSSHEVKR